MSWTGAGDGMTRMSRDRDADGRPRNARPRDILGRPLPRDAESAVPRVPDDLVVFGEAAVELGQRYLDEGLPFHAHEVFEAAWKQGPADERDFWQGLAQLAVGVTHALRGNRIGARALLGRAVERLSRYAGPTYGVDTDEVVRHVREYCARLDDGDGELPGIRLLGRTAPPSTTSVSAGNSGAKAGNGSARGIGSADAGNGSAGIGNAGRDVGNGAR